MPVNRGPGAVLPANLGDGTDTGTREVSTVTVVALEPNDRACPELAELEKILEECRDNWDGKVLVSSEWERMNSELPI